MEIPTSMHRSKNSSVVSSRPDLIISQSVQQESKWLAFHKENVNPALPWRLNHRHLNMRMSEDRFRELFEEVKRDEE